MTEPVSLSLAIRPLMSVAGKVLQSVQRLNQERSAARIPITGQTGPPELDRFFDATLARLSGGTIEDGWWRSLLNQAGHRYVAPDVLQREDLQAWLRDDLVQADFKALAGARLLETPEAEIRSRLQERYAAITQEAEYLTDEPIEVVVAILLAAFVASLGPGGEQLASLTLGGQKQIRADLNRGFDEVTRRLEDLGPNRLTEEVHTQRASEELTRIRQRRAWAPALAREQVRQLVDQVQSGLLKYTAPSAQREVLYWAARLHASEPEHLEEAKSFRDRLRQFDPLADTRIVDAVILETEGDGDRALQMLRDAANLDDRSAFFLILHRVHGPEAALEWFDGQQARHHSHFLTGLGWSNVALALARVDRWEEAAALLSTTISEHQEEWPDLLYLEGVINAALLVPSKWRRHALDMNIFHPWVHTIEGPEAKRRRERATLCFQTAEKRMATDFPERASGAREWLRWLRLTDPDSVVSKAAREEVREGMEDPANALSLLPMARAFDIPFEAGRLKGYLDQRMRLGGLEDHELQARFLLAEMSLEPNALIAFLDEEEAVFRPVVPPGLLSLTRIEALAKTNQTSKARSLLGERQEEFREDERQRIEAMLEEHEGCDPRPRLEQLYESSHDLIDLQNLVRHLHRVRDWTSLRRRLEELFELERTLENALHLVDCMRHAPESDEADVLAFLESNEDLVDRNPDLISARAWTLFRAGRLAETRVLNDRLLSERNHPADLQLDINLALQSGEWEKFASIVDREWPKREELAPDTLIQLASLAAEADLHPTRAVELVRLAVSRRSGDPHLLMAAIDLFYRFGREGEELGEWLSQAKALSSEEGPVRAFDTRTLLEEWMPAHRERRRAIQEEWLNGNLPLHMAATGLNVQLSYLLIGLPRSNTPIQDGRRRSVIPIVSGARQPVLTSPEWTVGLDATSIMVLAQLGLLRKAIESFQQVILAPDTMLLLLKERNRVRFHQPSLVKKAQEILALIGTGQIQSAEALPSPPQWLSEEVGTDLAQLLLAAKESQGRVVRPRPVHRLQSFLEEEAHLGEYENLVVSTVALERLLHRRGDLDETLHDRAGRYLLSQDRDTNPDAEMSVLEQPLYLDDLAVAYLHSAGLLPALVNCGLHLRVHSSLSQEQSDLIATHQEGEQLAEAIEEIRLTLRDALQAGKIGFLPRHNPTAEEARVVETAPTLIQFMKDAGPCQALSFDDRYLNRNATFTIGERSVPVLCVLDILRHLETQSVLTPQARQNALHRLRQSGFAFVPVESDELKRLLTSVHWQDGTFTESAELRIIRQSLARVRSLDILRQPEEMSFLGSLLHSSLLVIGQLWSDEALPIERAAHLTDWTWRHVAPSPLDWHADGGDGALIPYLSLLLQPLPIINEDRRKAFLSWMQERALEPLLPANSNALVRLAVLAGHQIEEWSEKIAAEDRDNSDS